MSAFEDLHDAFERLAAELWAVQSLLCQKGIATPKELETMELRARSKQDQAHARLDAEESKG